MRLNKLLIGTLLMMTLLISIVGCVSEIQKEKPVELSGTLRLGGSTTVYPAVKKAAEAFMYEHHGVNIAVTQSSTGEGLVQFLKGEIDIVDGTRAPHDEEYIEAESKGMTIQMTVIGNDAVVLVVHKDNPLRDISIEQLRKIFLTGEISDWSLITGGKKTGKIKTYGTNPEISGTAELFISKIGEKGFERTGKDYKHMFIEGYTQLHPTPTVVPTVAKDPDGIAYTPLKWVDDSVVLLSIEGVMPTEETVLDTSYALSRRMLMMTNDEPEGLTRDFIRFILSAEGQMIVKSEGFVPVVEIG